MMFDLLIDPSRELKQVNALLSTMTLHRQMQAKISWEERNELLTAIEELALVISEIPIAED